MQRRKLDFVSFDQFRDDVRALAAGPYDRAGQWSLAQAADHIAMFLEMSMEGFSVRVPWYLRIGGRPMKWITLRRRSIPSGIKGPPGLMPPEGRTDKEAAERLLGAIARYTAHTQPLHPSPLFGRLPREEWDQIHLIHAAHHFSFLIPGQPIVTPAAGRP
ncbi:MAG: DUF1569 domain-containing protein [Burkholderiales bacterium]|nr:DUF1569 domain-containing protein [Phycisphaerae bacterium]